MKQKGNILIFSIFLIATILVIFMLILLIFMSEVNALLYNIKLDMYSINKSAVISVNKGITSRNKFSYDEKYYKKYFENMLKANYQLDNNLENINGIVQKVKILEYSIDKKGKKDKYTKQKLNANTIHSVVEVKIKPVLHLPQLENLFIFEIHEDVALNLVEM